MTRDEVSNKLVEYFQKNGYPKIRNNGSGVTACKENSCDLNVLLEARGRKHVIVHVYPHYDEYEVDLGWSWEKTWDTGDYERLKEVVDNARMWIESGSRVGCKAVIRETKKVGATQTRQFEEPQDCCEKIARLRDSVVFSMSQGSHELFHTNIWAWLINKDNDFIKDFFGTIDGTFLRVEREQGNRDLTIWMDDNGSEKAYVVENKFKALPREEQLNEYKAALESAGQFGGGLLVCLQAPSGSDEWAWNVITQDELMGRLEQRVRNSAKFSDFEREIVIEYAKMTRELAEVLVGYSGALRESWPAKRAEGRLEEARLGDIFKKMKAAELVQFIEEQEDTELLRARAEREGLSLIVRPSYSNKSGIVDFRVVKKSPACARGAGKSPYAFGIGIQLQGEQYRRCAHIDRAQYHVSDDELYSRFSDENGWLDNRAFMGQGTSMQKKFCKYVTKGEVFVYQYVDLKDYSFSEIYKKMVADLTMVIQMMESGALIEAFVAE